jgi:hypothetical protein
MIDHRVVHQLRAAGHQVFVTSELGVEGQDDQLHLEEATRLGAVLVTQNQRDFARLHHRWQAEGRAHAGILLVAPRQPVSTKLACLDRVGRLLTPESARNQLMVMAMFESETLAHDYVTSLMPLDQ